MIHVASESLLTLSQLAKRIPRRRQDRPVHPSTCHRWRHPGIGGIRLECVRIGGVWFTSLEAYQRWVEMLTFAAEPPVKPEPPATVLASDAADQDGVERRLRDLDPIEATGPAESSNEHLPAARRRTPRSRRSGIGAAL